MRPQVFSISASILTVLASCTAIPDPDPAMVGMWRGTYEPAIEANPEGAKCLKGVFTVIIGNDGAHGVAINENGVSYDTLGFASETTLRGNYYSNGRPAGSAEASLTRDGKLSGTYIDGLACHGKVEAFKVK